MVMKSIVLFALVLLSVGCAMEPAAATFVDPGEPTVDGAAPTPDALPPSTEVDAGARTDTGAPEVSAPTTDAGTDALPPPSSDAGPSRPDAIAPTSDGGTDAPASQPEASAPDAAPPSTDARPDMVPPAGDAGTVADVVDAAADPLACPPSAPASRCASVTAADQAIRDTFGHLLPCHPEGMRMCGGAIHPDVAITHPMVCRDGKWRLAGTWSGAQWVLTYRCSNSCAASTLCDP